jgi:hypothetical protein
MPSPAQLTTQPLTFKLVLNEKLGAQPRPFFMSKPTIKQVWQNGSLVWEVTQGGMVRHFQHDWQARWHYEQCLRYYRRKVAKEGG